MNTRGGKLIATDEATVVPESVFDAVMMEDGQSDGCLANPASTNESDGCEVFRQTYDLLDQFVTSKAGSRCWGR